MSHKPTPPRKPKLVPKTAATKNASSKSKFVAPKTKLAKQSEEDDAPFKLVTAGPNQGMYARLGQGWSRYCGLLEPLGQTTNPDGANPAIRVCLHTHVGTKQYWDIPQELLQTPMKVLAELVKRGLVVDREQSKNLAGLLCMYLQTMLPDTTWLRVIKDGWHTMPDQSLGYMYGDKLICTNPLFKLAPQRSIFAKVHEKGKPKDWLRLTKNLGDDRLPVLLLSAAFAAPLLKPMQRDAALVNLYGTSGTGKTTALKLVCAGFGAQNNMVTWDSTDNGIEAATRGYQHRPFVIDEIGQGNGKLIAKSVYAFTNASGKLRADSEGNLRETERNCAMAFSAGEESPIVVMKDAGLKVQDGQTARLACMPVIGKHGIWDTVRGYGDGAEKSKAVTRQLEACHGHAAATFLMHVVKHLPSLQDEYIKAAPKLRAKLCQGLTVDAQDGVFDRMMENFVLFAFAGLMAVDAKAVGWSKQQVVDAVAHGFALWHAERHHSKPVSDQSVMNSLRLFFQSQRGGKFKPYDQFTEAHNGTVAGYEHPGRSNSEPLFLVYQSYFENVVCKGLDLKTVVAVLRHQDLLVLGSNKTPTKPFHVPGSENRNVSFYAIKQSILLN